MLHFSCVNCESQIHWSRRIKIYCSDFCKEQAKNIRWIRSTISRGVFDLPDVAEARMIRIAHLNAGGYIGLKRKIPFEMRMEVVSVSKSRCAECDIFTLDGEIDHIVDSTNDLSNLQLLCIECHRRKTLKNIKKVEIDDPDYQRIALEDAELRRRSLSPVPVKVCDDFSLWSQIEKRIRFERRILYHNWVYQEHVDLLESKETLGHVSEELNRSSVKLFSGTGSWSRKSINQMKKDSQEVKKHVFEFENSVLLEVEKVDVADIHFEEVLAQSIRNLKPKWCNGKNQLGYRCGNRAMKGQSKCHVHSVSSKNPDEVADVKTLTKMIQIVPSIPLEGFWKQYGSTKSYHPTEKGWKKWIDMFPEGHKMYRMRNRKHYFIENTDFASMLIKYCTPGMFSIKSYLLQQEVSLEEFKTKWQRFWKAHELIITRN